MRRLEAAVEKFDHAELMNAVADFVPGYRAPASYASYSAKRGLRSLKPQILRLALRVSLRMTILLDRVVAE